MKALIVFNPKSGKGRFKKKINKVSEILKSKGYTDITIFESKKPLEITKYLVMSLENKNFDVLLASGGDGTLHEVINGLMSVSRDKRPGLLYFPTGTINDVGHMFGLNYGIDKTLSYLDEDNLVKWDICKVNGKYFDYVAGCGKFTPASYQTNHPKIKRVFGVFYYAFEAVKEVFRYYHMDLKIKYDEKEINGKYCLLLAMNSSRVGALSISTKDATLDDGLMNLYLFDDKVNVRIITLVKFFLSRGRYLKGVTKIESSKFEIYHKKKIMYNLDGERGIKTDHSIIEICPKEISIYVSATAKNNYFLNQ